MNDEEVMTRLEHVITRASWRIVFGVAFAAFLGAGLLGIGFALALRALTQ